METIKSIDLNKLRDEAYRNAVEHGWHDEDLSNEHFLCLVISELMEAVQAERIGKHADIAKFKEWQGNSIPFCEETRVRRFQEDFEAYIKDSVEDELSDTCIRLFDFAGLRGIDLNSYKYDYSNTTDYSRISFTESAFLISYVILNEYHATFCMILEDIFSLCRSRNIDILWHIEMKMKYNRTRPRMHGNKKF